MLNYQPGLIIVNRFELKQELGVGGMGIVFGAMDRVLDEEVALKFLPPAMARDREAVEQFAREVKRARKVSGRYVLRVYDIWDDGEGGWFVTMEWARGGDLTAYRRNQGLLLWEQVKDLLAPILLGLQAVHEAGIVHRDVKPANILFREEGIPIVADFGISKSIMASMSRISQDTSISGTPAYMAPEAIRGTDDIGPATDLYAVGSMAYEMLTGHTPFTGDPMSVMYNQTHSDPSFRDLPVEAVRWIGACLIKDPGKRAQSAQQLLEGLTNPSGLPEYALGAQPVSEPSYAPPPAAPPVQPSIPSRPPRKVRKASAAISEQTYKIGARPSRRAEPEKGIILEPPDKGGTMRNALPWFLGAALLVLVVLIGVVGLRGKGGGEAGEVVEEVDRAVEKSRISKPAEKPKPDPRAEIIALEEKARQLFRSDNLTSGVSGNVWEVCREIRSREPRNVVCAELVAAMESKYEGWIESSLRAGDCVKAEGYAASLAKIGGSEAYDNRIGECKERQATQSAHPLGKPGEHLWKVRIGGSNFSSSPVIGGKKVYVGGKDTNLYCLSVENGEVLWKFSTNGGIGSSPTLMGDKVYFGSYDSTFYCLDRHSGSKIWSQKVGDRIVSSPLANGKMVYCGSNDGKVYAWESVGGTLKWSFQTAGRVWARPLVIGAKLFVGSLDRIFYCLDPRSGELRWSLTTDGAIYTTAAVSGNRTVVFGTNSGSLYKVHQETGETLWKKSLSPIYSSPAIADGRIYLGRKDGRFQCLSVENGEEIWSHATAADIRSSPQLEGGTVYVGGYDGKMYAFSKSNGKREWEYDTRSKVYATPSIAGGRILFGDMTGWFHALAVKP